MKSVYVKEEEATGAQTLWVGPYDRGCPPKGLLISLKGTSLWDGTKENTVIYNKILKDHTVNISISLKNLYPATDYDVYVQSYNDEGRGLKLEKR